MGHVVVDLEALLKIAAMIGDSGQTAKRQEPSLNSTSEWGRSWKDLGILLCPTFGEW